MWWIQIPPLFLFLPSFIHSYRPEEIFFKSFGLILLSGAIHTLYRISIGKSYEKGDLSLVYPIARSAPALVAIWSIIFLHERLTGLGAAGIAFVIFGCHVISLKKISPQSLMAPFFALKEKPYQFALITMVLISFYYIVDKMTLSYINPLSFRYLMQLSALFFYSVLVLPFKKIALLNEWKLNKKAIASAGIIQFVSYLLLLYGMKIAPVSYASAIRQISIPIGALVGTFVLKEGYGFIRFLGAILVFTGILVIALKA
jgi:drug/metabolite transporter (DMT)-like permease